MNTETTKSDVSRAYNRKTILSLYAEFFPNDYSPPSENALCNASDELISDILHALLNIRLAKLDLSQSLRKL